jgi:L-alanine-DL-glutamate epimerase-like enolase superfamily enzyme
MKITAVIATPLWAPRRKYYGRPMKTAQSAFHPAGGEDVPECLHALVRVRTDSPSGVEGVGEVATCWAPDAVELCRIIDQTLSPLLVGSDPFEIARCATAAADGSSTNPAPPFLRAPRV